MLYQDTQGNTHWPAESDIQTHAYTAKVEHFSRQTLTIAVGQKLYQAVEAGVADSAYVRRTSSNGLDGGCHKVFVHAANVGLWGTRTQ